MTITVNLEKHRYKEYTQWITPYRFPPAVSAFTFSTINTATVKRATVARLAPSFCRIALRLQPTLCTWESSQGKKVSARHWRREFHHMFASLSLGIAILRLLFACLCLRAWRNNVTQHWDFLTWPSIIASFCGTTDLNPKWVEQPVLVGGLEHVLFSIICGIILPIDIHIFHHQPELKCPW